MSRRPDPQRERGERDRKPGRHLARTIASVTLLAALMSGRLPVGDLQVVVVAALMVVAIPVIIFSGALFVLIRRGVELAENPDDIRALLDSVTTAFGLLLAGSFWQGVASRGRARRHSPPGGPPVLAGDIVPRDHPVGAAPARLPDARRHRHSTRPPRRTGSFWDSLTPVERAALATATAEHTYDAGATLCRQNGHADRVIVIRSGTAQVSVSDGDGEQVIAVRGPGDIIGERATLQTCERSATVTALTEVRALVAPTATFNAFLEDHPRVLSVLEKQIYNRLTDGLLLPTGGPARAAAAGFAAAGQNCAIVLTDIAGFGALHRNDEDRRAIRQALYKLLREAFEASGISWRTLHHEDRGDGALIVVRPDTPTRQVVEPMLGHLTAGLDRHNRDADEATHFKLRVAVNVGPVTTDAYGVTGEAIIKAARLLETPAFKKRLAGSPADVGFIASLFVYENVIRHCPGKIATGCEKVGARVKESSLTGWMYFPALEPSRPAH